MTSRSRVDRLGGWLGVDAGPKAVCPACEGTGRQHQVDGPWRKWEIAKRFAALTGQVFTEVEPAEALEQCGPCRGTGLTSEAKVAERQWRAEDAKARAFAKFEQIAKAMGVSSSAEPVDTPPALRAVPDA